MAVELLVAPDAAGDIDLAYQWYENQRPALGNRFLSRFRECATSIVHSPEAHAIVLGRYRRALLHSFPYAVFYSYEEDVVTIYAVLHTARDPAQWTSRLL